MFTRSPILGGSRRLVASTNRKSICSGLMSGCVSEYTVTLVGAWLADLLGAWYAEKSTRSNIVGIANRPPRTPEISLADFGTWGMTSSLIVNPPPTIAINKKITAATRLAVSGAMGLCLRHLPLTIARPNFSRYSGVSSRPGYSQGRRRTELPAGGTKPSARGRCLVPLLWLSPHHNRCLRNGAVKDGDRALGNVSTTVNQISPTRETRKGLRSGAAAFDAHQSQSKRFHEASDRRRVMTTAL
jgi:hypothetical protein